MNRRDALITVSATAFSTLVRGQPAANATTLKLLVAAAPGGVPDVRARWLADRLDKALGRTVVVENRPAVGGALAMSEGARAPADGSVVIFSHQGVLTITPHLQPQLRYDPLIDFTPVTRFGTSPLLLAVHPDVPAHTLADLVQLSKSRSGGLRYATPGIGTPPHLATELLLRQVGLQAAHIPFKGGGDAQRAVLAGHVEFQIEGIGLLLPQVKAGRARPLAVTSARRVAALPDVPTMAEAGAAGYEFLGWTGLVLPARAPTSVVQLLSEAVARIADSPEGREWFQSMAAEPGLTTPEAFAALIRSEHDRHGRLIREAGIRAE